MDQEIRMIEDRLDSTGAEVFHGRRFCQGTIHGVQVVTAISGYGKVGAAATTATAIEAFDAAAVIFGGVAGGIRPDVNIGDIVIGNRLVQHDFDASPIFERYVIPSLGTAEIAADPDLTEQVAAAADRYISTRARSEIADIPEALFEIEQMKILRGLIASGDRFIGSLAEAATLQGELPDVLAVEMEGAAVAQVCRESDVPFAVFRSISDRSDQDAEFDFMAFVASVAAPLTAGIIDEWARALG